MRKLQEPLVKKIRWEAVPIAYRIGTASLYLEGGGMQQFDNTLEKNGAALEDLLYAKDNADIKKRSFFVYDHRAAVYFLDGMISTEYLQHFVLEPCLLQAHTAFNGIIEDALCTLIPVSEISQEKQVLNAAFKLMNGQVVMLVDAMQLALCFDLRMYVRRGISPPITESVVTGPHQGFNESIRDNITMIRRVLPTPKLIGEMWSIGKHIPVSLCVMYLNDTVDPGLLAQLKNRLDGINIDHVMSIGALEQLVEDHPFALLPQTCLTERPDRAASFLLEGQILLLLDGSPQALCMPVGLLHLLHTPDDTSARWISGSFVRILRYIGALCSLLLPGLFVAIVVFQPEALPVTMLTAVLESQAAVPFSIPMEMLVMLLMFNLIIEAGTRVPGVVGSTLGTVSGLVLGQAAVEARLVHPLLIIVVAVASLGSFAIPDYALSLALRIGQFLFLLAGTVFGVYGIVLCMTIGTVRVASMQSLGMPYLTPVAPNRQHNMDVWLRWPIWKQRYKTWISSRKMSARTNGRMRAWDKTRK